MTDFHSIEDKRDYINEVKQAQYDSKVQDHLSSMSRDDIAGVIRYNSDQLGEMFDHHIFPCEDPEAWIDTHAELLAELWIKHPLIIGLLSQQMEHDLTNEAENVIDDQGWME